MSVFVKTILSVLLVVGMIPLGAALSQFSQLDGVLADTTTFLPLVIKPGNAPAPTPTPPGPTPQPSPSPSPSPTIPPTPFPPGMIVVDHTSVALFDDIPTQYLTAARELDQVFSDRSVGQNIHESLNCLSAASYWPNIPSFCRKDYSDAAWNVKLYTEADYLQGTVPERILFDPDPVIYDRSNWTFVPKTGSWSELTEDFITVLAPQYIDSKDVLSYQFSYLNVTDNTDIADPETGFFADNPDKYDVHDLEAYIAQHTDKVFIFWTSSLARGIGTQVSEDFNNQMRAYAAEHGKILFDVADIEAHTDTGAACHDNRDGVQYCNPATGSCENHPDDGLDLAAICQDWTTETDGGHLGSVSGGGISIAKAYWVLMARIAGWDGTP